jgi:ketosteroid isomerase-like protein
MDTQEREVFAKEWLRGWNERDLTQILSHYSEDVEFQSPVAVHLLGETWRMIKGKKDLASYFERGLASSPGKIEFEFLGVFHGSLAGEGTCRVAADGTTMTASSGFDSQLQSFTMTVLK